MPNAPNEWYDGLTARQRRFCEHYASNGGNQTRAAAEAGYSSPEPRAAELVRNRKIVEALDKLQANHRKATIMTREQRQEMWTSIARDESVAMKDRLRASELLGKSQADFVERHEVTGANGGSLSVSIYIPSNGRDAASDDDD